MAEQDSTTEHSGICIECAKERIDAIIGAVFEIEENLGVSAGEGIHKREPEFPTIFTEVAETLDGIRNAAFELAEGFDIDLFGDEGQEEELKRGYLIGRIEGLAGTSSCARGQRYALPNRQPGF